VVGGSGLLRLNERTTDDQARVDDCNAKVAHPYLPPNQDFGTLKLEKDDLAF
jgi:hypothetical protein